MQNQLKITCFQPNIIWEDIDENIKKYNAEISELSKDCDLIVLPEMFTSGFSLQPSLCSETMNGSTVSWMIKVAKEQNIAIMGSLIIRDKGNFFNRLIFVYPSGEIESYNKRHLFTLAGEDKVYTAGSEKLIIEYLGWKICPMICYDLRFPVWSRNVESYDVLIYVANWPKPRVSAWDTLLKARAIENMSYVVGVNRIGEDDNNLTYVGHSQGLDMFGELLSIPNYENEGTIEILLDKQKLDSARSKFQFLNDKDSFLLKK